ncbi:phenylacetate-CoA oxygenase subunit PaaC [Hazenella sp. IB182357]|uniref:Phenylacetate-CoA oxygenase subunit PaaC n=2 Tax=Polycladospora coralii TaxID=2771432 RepID=A0A926NAP4_9BACL|nr:phenylacetate-CoA oxygenase subunit PaaC [Polycladospora coralii]MBS7529613.1 phenylacetate-CoA oxygenase subunit PaaC [Polycladospora coralii]
MADDKLLLGHRDSEWLGCCPDIEGDVAFSSIAQDEVGHATFYYQLLHQLGEDDPDRLAFGRDASKWRNCMLVERENDDWTYSITRHLFFDQFDQIRLQAMCTSSYEPLQHGVKKMIREEYYHLLHMKTWFKQLGRAGGVATQKLQQAIEKLWPDVNGMFSFAGIEEDLLRFELIQLTPTEMRVKWEAEMKALFQQANMSWPGEFPQLKHDGRKGEHSAALKTLLLTMGEVYQSEPSAKW